jgi:hypothetical protein
MPNVLKQFELHLESKPKPESVVKASSWRFTLLTSRLIRIEYDPSRQFEDHPSQVFWFRNWPIPDYQHTMHKGILKIETEHLRLSCKPAASPKQSELEIQIQALGLVWHLGDHDPANLGGTCRTLDRSNGAVPLEPGLVSRAGWSLVDDTHSLVFNEHSWLEPRSAGEGSLDLYFFGYGHDYEACIHDYTKLSGNTPLIPRWALGNWWSRYWEYTQDELTSLMREFQKRETPLSVCIVDMDWHITETGNESTGWTGYTWNPALFPNPDKFLQNLQQLGLRVALNLHPAEGIHPHEADYPAMARRMGIDPDSARPVPFDLTDPHFARAYFEILHHPQERRGVDFWWLDWQQGTFTNLHGLDPLWWLNHLHALDLARDGNKRPFIFSRWGGLGNHRYPIGFSGDTQTTWKTLAFQPYFTATAANVAYGWWSHDIGGHMRGTEDAELYTRWVQFGVLSPIFRLHSTKNPFHERLPWKYDAETERLARAAMRFRYALIPYLYSMAWREHQTGATLIRPMYYADPEEEASYHAPNQYLLGSELIAAPFTSPRDLDTRLARQTIWLPDGDWYSFPSGRMYKGGQWHAVYGRLEDIPIFARAGAILPLGNDSGWNTWQAPHHIQIHIFPGASNHFELYEDDGETTDYQNGAFTITPMHIDWREGDFEFRIGPTQGEMQWVPDVRVFDLYFYGLAPDVDIALYINDVASSLGLIWEESRLKVTGVQIAHGENVKVKIRSRNGELVNRQDPRPMIFQELLKAYRLQTVTKGVLNARMDEFIAHPERLGSLRVSLTDTQVQALLEMICNFGFTRITQDGSDRIILWNPNQYPEFIYQFSIEQVSHRIPDHYAFEGGQVPTFRAFDLTQPQYQAPWRFQVQYLNQLQIVLQGNHFTADPKIS